MTSVIGGSVGSGKTLYALSIIEEAVKSGRPVYTNIQLAPACPYYDRVALIDDPEGKYPVARGEPGEANYRCFWHYVQRGSVVVVDEADIYFWCREGSKFGRDIFEFHKEQRKLGLDLVYIVQRIGNLALSVRSLAQRFILCEWNYRSDRLFSWFPMRWSRWLRSEFAEPECRKVITDGYWSYNHGASYFPWYRTDQILGNLAFCRAEVDGG